MQAVWANILKNLRESQEYALFALASSLNDVTFTADQIVVQTTNDAAYQMLTRADNLALLQQYCGGAAHLLIKPPVQFDESTDTAYVLRLQELFGDRLEIL